MILFVIVSSKRYTCMTSCHEVCSVLNGNIAHECGSCSKDYKCNPRSTDFRSKNDHTDKEAMKAYSPEDDDDNNEE